MEQAVRVDWIHLAKMGSNSGTRKLYSIKDDYL